MAQLDFIYMFLNRKDAGIRLAERLGDYKDQRDALVLALPKGERNYWI